MYSRFLILLFLMLFPISSQPAINQDALKLCTVEPMLVRIWRCGKLEYVSGTARQGHIYGQYSKLKAYDNYDVVLDQIYDQADRNKLVIDFEYCDQ